jgi:DNA-binding NtrC family response regulator
MNAKMELECLMEPAAARRVKKLWLVDDDQEYREFLAGRFRLESDINCARQFSSAEAALVALIDGPPPDVILLDMNMGGMSGVDAVRPIKSLAPATRVLMLTSLYNLRAEADAFRAGACGFLLKVDDFSRILDLVRDPQPVRLPTGSEAIRPQESPSAINPRPPLLAPGGLRKGIRLFFQRLFRSTFPKART